MLDASLLSGPLPIALTLAALAALALLLARRSGSWWRRTVPIALAATGSVIGLAWLALRVWQPFPDELPASVLLWSSFGLLGLGVGITHAVVPGRRGWWRAAGALLAVPLILAVAAMQVDAVYGYRPTLRAALGLPGADEVDFGAVNAPDEPVFQPAQGEPLWQAWRPRDGTPAAGVVTHVPIPGTASGFTGREAEVYLPPAYLAPVRPALPVLVLVSGQPGSPRDWVVAGRVPKVMDTFAAAHRGLAPVVVVPDGTGTALANPLCMDSDLGKVETYLTVDVPDWVRGHLQVDRDTRHWAIGGFSYGGTCALQLAVRRPDVFPTFLDIGGQQEPTLGSGSRTVQAAFGGDQAKFKAVTPMELLATGRFPDSAGVLAAGTRDQDSVRENAHVASVARRAGMSMHSLTVTGAHTWVLAAEVLRTAMPWLADRAGLVAPGPHPELDGVRGRARARAVDQRGGDPVHRPRAAGHPTPAREAAGLSPDRSSYMINSTAGWFDLGRPGVPLIMNSSGPGPTEAAGPGTAPGVPQHGR